MYIQEEYKMYVVKEEQKVNVLKIVLICLGIAAVVGAIVAGVIIWKKKKNEKKQIEEQIDAAIDAAFAEEDTEVVSVDIV